MRSNAPLKPIPSADSRVAPPETIRRGTSAQSAHRMGGCAHGSVYATGIRRLIAGVLFGIVTVGVLWYFMQSNHQIAALTTEYDNSRPAQGVVLVTVVGGDSLWSITAPHRPPWLGQEEWVRDVAAYNQIDDDVLFPGQVLAIPTFGA